MSTASQIISINWAVAGVATDFDSTPLLRDAAHTYGVRTVPPGTTVVASGTAMVRSSTGQYSYTVTGLTPGQVYQYSIEKVYLGNTTWTAKTFTAASNPSTHYGSRAGIEAIAGITNADVFADLQAGGDPTYIASRFEAALTDSDSQIVASFAATNATIPGATSPYYGRLATIGNYLALCYLYRARSMNDDNARAYLKTWLDYAMTEMQNVQWALNRDQSIGGPILAIHDPTIAATMRASLPVLLPLGYGW